MTVDYNYNQRAGINPLAVNNIDTDTRRVWGVGVPGSLRPRQAVSSGPFDSVPILTRVDEPPWSVDDQGIPIDQANVWAVRTRAMSIGGTSGEIDWYTHVPRTLDAAYTPRGRSHLKSHVYDHLGEDPFQGVIRFVSGTPTIRPVHWRTATGQYPTNMAGDGYLWVPMNLNQQTTSELTMSGTGAWYSSGGVSYFKKSMALPHVGFRGARLIFGTATAMTLYFGYTNPAAGAPSVIGDITNLWTQAYGAGASVDTIITLPYAASPGTRMTYHLYASRSPTGGTVSATWRLGPRHDCPLWYFASTRNRVAPGGTIT